MGTLAVGSDGGGSIRIPSSLTGVFGHKATVGRVPYYPPTAVGTCAIAGPMTRTVRDAALMMNVVTGDDVWRRQLSQWQCVTKVASPSYS
jgi:aspartyl-tRNA(Asn)/glutamyl-tRNA(Gln) amidotransferase subunit A